MKFQKLVTLNTSIWLVLTILEFICSIFNVSKEKMAEIEILLWFLVLGLRETIIIIRAKGSNLAGHNIISFLMSDKVSSKNTSGPNTIQIP